MHDLIDTRHLHRYDHIIIHCAATRADQAEVDAAWIDRIHKERGWRGCGYHVVITRGGDVQTRKGGHPARPLSQAGAHVGDCGPGWNSRSLGICLAGGIDSRGRPQENFSDDQELSLSELLRTLLLLHPARRTDPPRIIGHRDLIRETGAPPKACPCFDVGDFLIAHAITPRRPVLRPEMPQEQYTSLPRDEGGSELLLTPAYHTVEEGDTYWCIARAYGIPLAKLARLNGLAYPTNRIQIGQRIRLT
jgi:N-acetylmuramoyl-L-alanine amidase